MIKYLKDHLFAYLMLLNSYSAIANSTEIGILMGGMGHKPWDFNASFHARVHFDAAVHCPPVKIKTNFMIQPGFVKKWDWDNISKKYIFEIADNIFFHNGKILTAYDFELAFIRSFIIDMKNSMTSTFLRNIKGADKLKIGQKYSSGMFEGIKVLSNKKLEVYLNNNDPSFLYTLADAFTPVVPLESLEENLIQFKKNHPIGCGNYIIDYTDKKTSYVRLKRVKNLNLNAPSIIHYYNDHESIKHPIDIVRAPDKQIINKNTQFQYKTSTMFPSVGVIDFNYNLPESQNKKFREMIRYAINKKKLLLQEQTNFKIAHEVVNSLYYGRSGLKDEFNIKKAKKILRDHFPQIKEKQFTISYHGSSKVPYYVQEIKKQLNHLGLKIKLKGVSNNSFEGENANSIMTTYGQVGSMGDPLKSFTFYLPDSSYKHNYPKNDKKIETLYKRIYNAETKEKRIKLVIELSKHFNNEIINIVTDEFNIMYAFNSKKIKSISPNESDFFYFDYDDIKFVDSVK